MTSARRATRPAATPDPAPAARGHRGGSPARTAQAAVAPAASRPEPVAAAASPPEPGAPVATPPAARAPGPISPGPISPGPTAAGPTAADARRDDRPEPPDLRPLRAPAEGVPELVATRAALAAAAEALAAGTGPVAVDAERASSFRYGQRAYLVQLRRAGAGTILIDPIAVDGDLSVVGEALRGVEWVLHAADQDLPCLAEAGMRPDSLFDTELAARLLGRARVGLSAVVADELGWELAKEHSAADWSVRPLPHDWLVYAALDVELLVQLRDQLAVALREAGKAHWALQEFEHVRTAAPKPAPTDPWRRLPHLSTVTTPRGLAVARELWQARDDLARRRDRSPTRVLPSASIVAAAKKVPRTAAQLGALPEFSGKGTRAHVPYWFDAVARALALPDADLPPRRAPREPGSLPQPRAWRDLRPEANERLDAVRAVVRPVAERLHLPQENLLQPAAQKGLAWTGLGEGRASADATPQLVAERLAGLGARPWQIDLVAKPLAEALAATGAGR